MITAQRLYYGTTVTPAQLIADRGLHRGAGRLSGDEANPVLAGPAGPVCPSPDAADAMLRALTAGRARGIARGALVEVVLCEDREPLVARIDAFDVAALLPAVDALDAGEWERALDLLDAVLGAGARGLSARPLIGRACATVRLTTPGGTRVAADAVLALWGRCRDELAARGEPVVA